MMNKVVLVLTFLSFMITQSLALSCELACAAIKTQKSSNDTNHDCCPSKKENKQKTKKKQSKCMGNYGNSCYHQEVSNKFDFFDRVELIKKIVPTAVHIGFNDVTITFKEIRYRPKLPSDPYVRFKTLQKIYILKNQFLI